MHPRPFLRTSSKCQLIPSCGYESPAPPVVEVKGAPQHVVIGFNLGSENSSCQRDVCESPRSVLEPGVLCAAARLEQSRLPRSPRSVLGSLLSGRKSQCPCTQGDGQGVIVDIKAEEECVLKFSSLAAGKNHFIAISEQNKGSCVRRSSVLESGFIGHPSALDSRDDEYDDLDVEEDHVTGGPHESIFCAASPFSTRCSLEFPGCDFLSICFFCKCRLTHGKDVYMYKGDKAFCSTECRYQQIVVDEFRERQSAAPGCFMGASTQGRSMLAGAPAAVA